MFGRLLIFAAALFAAVPASASPEALARIEQRIGGRLGVALVDGEGRLLLARRADERFAMCSTFKLPLAAMVLTGRISQRTPLPLTRADILPNSPYSERALASGHPPRAGFAAQAIVEQSDNAAANLLLRALGGPAAFTAWLRRQGDSVTRLDRWEMELNENAPGDVRDTTSPAAMAGLTRRLIFGDVLQELGRNQLRRWTIASTTGLRRIRAGLPVGWTAGDKTGSCGTAWNDVAWFTTPTGGNYTLAVYVDRATAGNAAAEAAIAEVGRIAAETVAR